MRPASWFRFGAAEAVFAYVLVMALASGESSFLDDPDTFWHLEVGRRIVANGAVPHVDELTFSKPGVPWVDQSWAFDVALAAIVDRLGWPGAVGLASLGLAWLYWWLARELARDGSSPWTVLIVAVLASRIGQVHFLVRPHLVTWGFALWMLTRCRRAHRGDIRALWPVPIVMALWANCHGGFLAGPVILGAAGFAHAVSGAWDNARLRRLGAFALALLSSLVAPLLTPYGTDLYRHVYELLFASGLTAMSEEFQPFSFKSLIPGPMAWALFALIILPNFARKRVGLYDLIQALAWLHLGLLTIRYTPLFGLAAAPALAVLCDGIFPERDRPPLRPWYGLSWPILGSVALVVALFAGAPLGKLGAERWPLAGLQALNQAPVDVPLFHEQNWGGMIESETQPRRPAFIDSRFEVFGKPFIQDYLKALEGGETWESLRDEHRFGLVWVKPDRGLARRLAGDPGWVVLHRDANSVLFGETQRR